MARHPARAGNASEETSTTGALRLIQDATGGALVLVALGIGLLLYAGGRILEVTTLATSEVDGKDKVVAQAAWAVPSSSPSASASSPFCALEARYRRVGGLRVADGRVSAGSVLCYGPPSTTCGARHTDSAHSGRTTSRGGP